MTDFRGSQIARWHGRGWCGTYPAINLDNSALNSTSYINCELQRNWSVRMIKAVLSIALISTISVPAEANNVGENVAWQFQTTSDMANRAFIEDMRQKRKSGYYAAPIYTTNIDRQYNCAVSSIATGNQSTSSAIANSPTTTGNSASSVGNTDSTSLYPGAGNSNDSVVGSQVNDGTVGSSVKGNVESSVRGDAYQALNNDQVNSGDQTAGVTSSTACQFGLLN